MKTILVDAVNCFVSKDGQIFKEMFDILENYTNKKIILTSASYNKYKIYNLDKMPYDVFTLEHNPEKTDFKYYEIMLKNFSLKKDDIVYFEHSIDAVKSAQSVGIKTYYYDDNKKNLEDLKKFLDENLL